ncbi:MAG TPA: ECF-type sigma factor [Gemmataceae bacterium]|nr:ECF-type sigma factor [Gemmataceae bacterium]
MDQVRRLLEAIGHGDAHAAEHLLPLVYDELRRLAQRKLAQEPPGQSLDATALVHEAYLRLVGSDTERRFESERGFFAAAAQAMRRILVDKARRKHAQKRGGAVARQRVQESQLEAPEVGENILALDEALRRFAKVDAQAAELVQLRYFAGLSLPKAAEILDASPRTAARLWTYARVWLKEALDADP